MTFPGREYILLWGPNSIRQLACIMHNAKQNQTWKFQNRSFEPGKRTLIMGILNVTPDSFSDGGKYTAVDAAVEHAVQMQDSGADIIDVGGESTRPGAAPLTEQEELDRIIPVVKALKRRVTTPISIDTYKSGVAEKALEAGASIINDISACRFDKNMARVAAASNAGLVLMHIKGEPQNMQRNPQYKNAVQEIMQSLQQSVSLVLKDRVDESQIVVDPGIGFGKRLQDNFQILNELRIFENIGRPILVGPSRKSFIGAILDLPPDERLEGTLAAVVAAIMNGASIVRVHDVKETKRVVDITDAILGRKKVA